MSNSATSWTAGSRLLCPPLFPGVCSNSCPLSQWCHPTISSSVLISSCPQSLPASESFPMSQLFTSGGQSIGALEPVCPMTMQDWFPLGLTGLISLQSKGFSRVFSSTTIQKLQLIPIVSKAMLSDWPAKGQIKMSVTISSLGPEMSQQDGYVTVNSAKSTIFIFPICKYWVLSLS